MLSCPGDCFVLPFYLPTCPPNSLLSLVTPNLLLRLVPCPHFHSLPGNEGAWSLYCTRFPSLFHTCQHKSYK